MSAYREAPRATTWPPPMTSTRRLVRRWVLDVLTHVFMGRPRLVHHLLVRELSRRTRADRQAFADHSLAQAFVAQEAENRAKGNGFRRRYLRHPWCRSCHRHVRWLEGGYRSFDPHDLFCGDRR